MKFKGLVSSLFGAALIASYSLHAIAGTETLLASAARLATTSTADQIKTTIKGIHLFIVVTAAPGVETLTVTVQGKDANGNYYTILESASSAAVSTRRLTVYPAFAASANVSISDTLPDIWRVTVTHSAKGSFTYSLVVNTLP